VRPFAMASEARAGRTFEYAVDVTGGAGHSGMFPGESEAVLAWSMVACSNPCVVH